MHSLFGLHAAIVGTIAFLISILLHEFGHALTARRFGVETESIQLWALGGVARLSREPSTPKAEGWIAVAGYVLAQSFGWTWGVDKKRRDTSRFVAAFSLMLLLAIALGTIGFDPLEVTLISVALTVVITPLVVLPFLVLMNEERYVKAHTSGPFGNGLLAILTVACALMALIVIPLQVMGGK